MSKEESQQTTLSNSDKQVVEVNNEQAIEVNDKPINTDSDIKNLDDLTSEGFSSDDKQITQKKQTSPSLVKVFFVSSIILIFITSLYFNLVSFFGGEVQFVTSNAHTIVLLFFMFVVSSFSLAFTYWLYYEKTLLLKDGPALVPEKWGKYINELSKNLTRTQSTIDDSMSFVSKNSQKQNEVNESLFNSFLTLQNALSERDKEIERLKSGYDSKIYKRFLNKFIRLSQSINEIYEESKGSEHERNYRFLSRSISVALEDCGVETYLPEVHSDYREVGPEVADEPQELSTSNPEEDFLIASVVSPAYVIESDDNKQIITPAKVVIYRYHSTETNTDR